MKRLRTALAAATLAWVAPQMSAAAAGPAAAAPAAAQPQFTSLAAAFSRFYDETAGLAPDARIRAFHARFDPLFPGFHQKRDGTPDDYDALIAKGFTDFPEIRARFDAVAAQFPSVLARGVVHFKASFPDFQLDTPIYLVNSFGEMDGGTRTIDGRNVMVFGADVIARIHQEATIGPFFDHELFHLYHGAYYGDCDQIRCALWQEGLATFASATMNDTQDPHLLMLDQPAPIAPAVNADMKGALCIVKAKLDSTSRDDYRPLFFGGKRSEQDRFPRRFGYYVGYLVAKEAARSMPLAALAHLDQAAAKQVIDRALDRLIDDAGGCGTS